jgi:cyclophilin family peptidyl-prolyl cis-trans isomerase/HEAT repeat protein
MPKTYKYPSFDIVFLLFNSRAGVLVLGALVIASSTNVFSQRRAQVLRNPTSFTSVPQTLLMRIIRAEDERRWDNDVRNLLSARSAVVRRRAALAAGRIGNEDSLAQLITLLGHDDELDVRAMAAFALGEVESASAADTLLAVLNATKEPLLRARSVEALGKIAAALPKEQEARAGQWGDAILNALTVESARSSALDRMTILLGLTAALRAKAATGGTTIARFLNNSDPRIRADAANTLARLRLKDGNDQLRKLLRSDPDPTARANAARVLGVTEDKASFDALLDRALKDGDSRVRVSAIRALASLNDGRATGSLIERGDALWLSATLANAGDGATPKANAINANELLEIATSLGRLKQESNDHRTTTWLRKLRPVTGPAPEVEIALARIHPSAYLSEIVSPAQESILVDWRAASSVAQGLGETAALPVSTSENRTIRADAQKILRAMLDYRNSGITINTLVAVHSEYAIPDVLRGLAAFKPKDLGEVLGKQLKESDVIIRATAAELLGELPPDEINTQALIEALPVALQDKELNDAALAILDSLAKQKNPQAHQAIKTALDSPDHLIRRKAVALLKSNGAGDFSSRIGTVQTRNTTADYERAIARIDKRVIAVVTTSKGAFTIQLFPDDAPLNVDNFVQLAKRGYFAGITFHRVVPNFVIQDGDPRGDGNGGPGYQIRCEINELPYERGALGMALSGKDTGGSQWFVTHSPQPHLDGGYTVFGKVIRGMDVVDNTVRGDVIRSIVIKETSQPASNRRR